MNLIDDKAFGLSIGVSVVILFFLSVFNPKKGKQLSRVQGLTNMRKKLFNIRMEYNQCKKCFSSYFQLCRFEECCLNNLVQTNNIDALSEAVHKLDRKIEVFG